MIQTVIAEDRSNREKLGITVGSVSFGQEHSKHFYNRLISALILVPQPRDSAEREKQACLKMLERIAIVSIEMTNYDVIHISRELRETRTSFSAQIGKTLVINCVFSGSNRSIFPGGLVGVYAGASVLSIVELLYHVGAAVVKALPIRWKVS